MECWRKPGTQVGNVLLLFTYFTPTYWLTGQNQLLFRSYGSPLWSMHWLGLKKLSVDSEAEYKMLEQEPGKAGVLLVPLLWCFPTPSYRNFPMLGFLPSLEQNLLQVPCHTQLRHRT